MTVEEFMELCRHLREEMGWIVVNERGRIYFFKRPLRIRFSPIRAVYFNSYGEYKDDGEAAEALEIPTMVAVQVTAASVGLSGGRLVADMRNEFLRMARQDVGKKKLLGGI